MTLTIENLKEDRQVVITSKFPKNLKQLQGYCLFTFVKLVWLVEFMCACVSTGMHVNINLFMCVHVW